MHQNPLPNNNDAQSTTKYGFLLRPNAQIVALRLTRPLKLHFGLPELCKLWAVLLATSGGGRSVGWVKWKTDELLDHTTKSCGSPCGKL